MAGSRRRAVRPRSTNLTSQATSFVGRRQELRALHELLGAGRLVTIHGPPGSGKTRLALRYAELHLEEYAQEPGGVWFVDLAEARDVDDLASAVGKVLGLPAEVTAGPDAGAAVARALAGQGRLLVVLDNVEHTVAPAAALVARWHGAASQARFLVTSREILRLSGEAVLSLEPLPVPDDLLVRREEALASEAVQLFVQRAPSYRLSEADAPVVAELVRRLEGLPLAIELAASRMRVLDARQLVERLRDRLDLLSGGPRDAAGRHATLRAAIAWSWDLLKPWESSALAQCSVFRGGFSLAAAEHVVDLSTHADAPPVIDVLQALCEKAFLSTCRPPVPPNEVRFRSLDSIREAGLDDLARSGRLGLVARRHLVYYAGLARTSEDDGARSSQTTDHLALERHNMVAAAEGVIGNEDPPIECLEAAARIVLALDTLADRGTPALLHAVIQGLGRAGRDRALLGRLLEVRGRQSLDSGASERGLADLEAAQEIARELHDPRLEAMVRGDLGFHARQEGRLADAERDYHHALALLRDASAPRVEAALRFRLAVLCHVRGRYGSAAAEGARALAIGRELGDRRIQAQARSNLAVFLYEQGHLGRARSHWAKTLSIHRELGDRWGEAASLLNLGVVAQEQGRFERAHAYYQHALARGRRLGWKRMVCMALGHLACLRLEQRRPEEARRLCAQALAIAHELEDRYLSGLLCGRLAVADAMSGALEASAAGFARGEALLGEAGHRSFATALAVDRGHLELARARRTEADGHHRRAVSLREAAAGRLGPADLRRDDAVPPSQAPSEVRFSRRLLWADLAVDSLLVGAHGEHLNGVGGKSVDLATRPVLSRILTRLVEARVAEAGRCLSADALVEAGWPGERILPAARTNRLKVALSTLRGLGLGSQLVHRPDGYLLDPSVPVTRVEPKAR